MGKSFIDQSPFFKAILVECDCILAKTPDPPTWSIVEEISNARDPSRIYEAEFAQPLCTAMQVGLIAILKSWGLKSDAVIGHSSGEIAAAYASGTITLKDAIITAYYRGLVLSRDHRKKFAYHLPSKGSMCAVGLNEKQTRELVGSISDQLSLAAVNSPTSCTVSGNQEEIKEIVNICKHKGIFSRELHVDMGENTKCYLVV